MKKPNTPGKWTSTDKSRTALTSVPASDVVDKTGAKVRNLPPSNIEPGSSHSAPVDNDNRHSKR
ncbi:hypothetical protein [Tahibacter amnicola]|uniref:Hypervirulence associated protein TUDOR domain-containing protein n=1 Tax=Tahibacter amnicola TaxID=2976241 RepID=A0ABY6B906_9GAMM|nr:hypothetical protein [Tahibacter amnicola]UXI66037.1 hypothetical protein N4264_14890 [Tahibacter amnicola]